MPRLTFARTGLVVAVWILTLLVPGTLSAQKAPKGQLQAPHAGYAYPAGARAGATSRIILGGQYLSPDARILMEGGGITVTVAGHHRPLTQAEFNKARDRIEEILKKAGAPKEAKQAADIKAEVLAKLSEAERAELRSLRQRMQEGNPRRVTNPAIAEILLVDVVVAPDAAVGTRELRILTEQGLSNPLVFKVGTLPEVLADEVSLDPPAEVKAPRKKQTDPQGAVARTETRVSLPIVANGRILQGGVDRFRFTATKGQRLVFATEARALIPYLADAVPGWFQATLTVFDAKGRELAYNDDYRFSPDPVVLFEVPADGEYMLDIKDAIFRGREDFVYRLTLGELPFVTGLFPLGGRAGASTAVEATGWNLKATKSVIDNTAREPGILGLSVPGYGHVARAVPFELTESSEITEREGNDRPEAAQPLVLPCVVNGRVDVEGDRDWFRFDGKAGETVVIEVRARRLGSPLDSQLRLVDAQGNQLGFSDDHEDKSAGLLTHHADSLLQAKLPADGVYRVELLDVQHQGGPACSYRLHLHAPREDFELRLDSSALNTKENGIVAFTVHALRRDGFDGPIQLTLADANFPARLDGAVIPAGMDRIRLTLTVGASARPMPYQFGIVGMARASDGRALRHLAVPADDMMQAFAYRQLVEAKTAYLFVAPTDARRQPLRVECAKPLEFVAGHTVKLFVPLPQRRLVETLRVELSEPPAGISIIAQRPAGTGLEVELGFEAARLKSGHSGNLVLVAHLEQTGGKKEKGKSKGTRKVPVGFLPALPYRIK